MLMYYMAKYPALHAKLPAWTYEPLKKDLCGMTLSNINKGKTDGTIWMTSLGV